MALLASKAMQDDALVLYDTFLKSRSHIFVSRILFDLCEANGYEPEVKDRLARSGVFGILGEEPAIIDVSDKAKLSRTVSVARKIIDISIKAECARTAGRWNGVVRKYRTTGLINFINIVRTLQWRLGKPKSNPAP